MLTIASVDVRELKIPFHFTFRHALASRAESHNVVVRVRDAEGREGWGESVPRTYVTGETPESVRAVVSDDLAPAFAGRAFAAFDEVTAALGEVLSGLPRDRHAAFCGFELALLDLAGRVFDRSAGDVLGPVLQQEVRYSGVVSSGDVEGALKVVGGLKEFGFPAVKVKVGEDHAQDVEVLRGAREILGPDCGLRIDANCAWEAEQALRRIEALDDVGLQGVEQPLRGDDLEGLAWLTARSPVPVVVDESLASVADAERLIAGRCCHAFNIRISKNGGLIGAARLRDLGRAAGVRCQLGAQVGETALLSAAGRQFATRSADVLFLEGSYGTLLLEGDVGRTDVTVGAGGRAPALAGPGLGVDVDAAVMAQWEVSPSGEACRSEGATGDR